MKNLYKKISSIALCASLSIGGYLPNRLISYANSPKSNSYNANHYYKWIKPLYNYALSVEDFQQIFDYVVLRKNPDDKYMEYALRLGKDYGVRRDELERIIEERYPLYIKDYYEKFENINDLQKYLLDKELPRGIYRIKVGNEDYILKFYKDSRYRIDLDKRINELVRNKEDDIWDILDFEKKYRYKVREMNVNKDVVLKKYKHIKLKRLNNNSEFKNGQEFKKHLSQCRKIERGLYKVKIGSLYVIFSKFK